LLLLRYENQENIVWITDYTDYSDYTEKAIFGFNTGTKKPKTENFLHVPGSAPESAAARLKLRSCAEAQATRSMSNQPPIRHFVT